MRFFAATVFIAVMLHPAWKHVSGATSYRLYVRQGTKTPWVKVTPVSLGLPPTTTPDIMEATPMVLLGPGTYDAAVSRLIGTQESVLSNVVTGGGTPRYVCATNTAPITATATHTPTITPHFTSTATAVRTATAIPAPTLVSCAAADPNGDGVVNAADVAIVTAIANGTRQCR